MNFPHSNAWFKVLIIKENALFLERKSNFPSFKRFSIDFPLENPFFYANPKGFSPNYWQHNIYSNIDVFRFVQISRKIQLIFFSKILPFRFSPFGKTLAFPFLHHLLLFFLFQMQINCNWINEKLCHFFSHIRWIYSSFWFKNVWIPMWIIYENFDISQYKYLWKMFSLLEFFLVFPFNRLNSLPQKKENLEQFPSNTHTHTLTIFTVVKSPSICYQQFCRII